MKKLSVMLIAISFYLFSTGSALANKPEIDDLERHANWSKIYDDKKQTDVTNSKTDSKGSNPMKPSMKSAFSGQGKSEGADFDFIRETTTYDHSKDKSS
jgi:hypothetical protein